MRNSYFPGGKGNSRKTPSAEVVALKTFPDSRFRSVRSVPGTGSGLFDELASRTNPSSAAVCCACWRGMRCCGPCSRDSFAELCAGGPCCKRVLASRPNEKRIEEQQAAPTARHDSLRTEPSIPSPERVCKKEEIAFLLTISSTVEQHLSGMDGASQ